jgi:hypothetical protein
MSPHVPEQTNDIAFNHKKILCSKLMVIIQSVPGNGLKYQIHLLRSHKILLTTKNINPDFLFSMVPHRLERSALALRRLFVLCDLLWNAERHSGETHAGDGG